MYLMIFPKIKLELLKSQYRLNMCSVNSLVGENVFVQCSQKHGYPNSSFKRQGTNKAFQTDMRPRGKQKASQSSIRCKYHKVH